MKISIDISGKKPFEISKKRIQEIVKKTIEKAGCNFLLRKEICVGVAFVSAAEIKRLNLKYRKENLTTDILSFSNYKGKKELKMEKIGRVSLGDLIIFFSYLKKSAKINNMPVEREVAYVVSHGVLHLLGFSHSKKMFSIQEEIADNS